jgi:lactate dehydrogenase-like 2-hydroxyacid dehydrogenase
MSKVNLLVLGPYPEWDMEELENRYAVHRLWEAKESGKFLNERRELIRAIATRGDLGASAELMEKLPNLEIVSVFGVGTDAVDLNFARAKNILVTNTPDVLTGDVADLGMALLLATARQMTLADEYVRKGAWAGAAFPLTTRVFGKKIGIVGIGRIGQAFARRAAAFDCDIYYFARSRNKELPYRFVGDLVQLAREVEFLVVIVAGGEGTKSIINAQVLEALGRDGILINISRGSTVDEEALLSALENGSIKAAGLDVYWNEPNINPRFLTLGNVVLQPHLASGTVETRKAMGKLVRDNLEAYFSGNPVLTPVT